MMEEQQSQNIIEENFIDYWKSLDFSNYNEQDVREEFITPLLKVLGYSTQTVNKISREETLTLPKQFHRIGRKQVKIDYIPTIRLKRFWIIEAKPGKTKTMDYGDYLQAHLYAIHPSIQCKYIVLTNGWEIRIYDTSSSSDWDAFIHKCTQEDCDQTFPKLRDLLSAKQLTSSLRNGILSTLKATLEVELDEGIISNFNKEFKRILNEALPKIQKNAKEFQKISLLKIREDDDKYLRSASFEILEVYLDKPTYGNGLVANIIVDRIAQMKVAERTNIVQHLIDKSYGRPHGVFRVLTLYILTKILERRIEIPVGNKFTSIESAIINLAQQNFSYFSWEQNQNNIVFALCHLDNISARLGYKIANRLAMNPLTKLTNAEKETLPIEEKLIKQPTVARHMVNVVEMFYEHIWRAFAGNNTAKEIWDSIWYLQYIEEDIVDKIPPLPYPDDDSDLLSFQYYGKSFDMLRVGSYNVLTEHLTRHPNEEITRALSTIISKSREDIIYEIPKPFPVPHDWQPSEADIASFSFIEKLLQEAIKQKPSS